jgi:hypothetical protein
MILCLLQNRLVDKTIVTRVLLTVNQEDAVTGERETAKWCINDKKNREKRDRRNGKPLPSD